jgi:hypothetical protein
MSGSHSASVPNSKHDQRLSILTILLDQVASSTAAVVIAAWWKGYRATLPHFAVMGIMIGVSATAFYTLGVLKGNSVERGRVKVTLI